ARRAPSRVQDTGCNSRRPRQSTRRCSSSCRASERYAPIACRITPGAQPTFALAPTVCFAALFTDDEGRRQREGASLDALSGCLHLPCWRTRTIWERGDGSNRPEATPVG